MTLVVTPTNGPWASTLSIPADGEAVSSASVLGYMQEVANRLEFLRQRTPGANPVANLLEIVYPTASGLPGYAADWSQTVAGIIPVWRQGASVAATGGPLYCLDNRLQQGMSIRGMAGDIVGKNGHGALPATMPTVRLLKFARSIGTAAATYIASGPAMTVVDTQSDLSANVAAYEVVHVVTKTLASPEVVDLANWNYFLQLNGEYGANFVAGTLVVNPRISVSA